MTDNTAIDEIRRLEKEILERQERLASLRREAKEDSFDEFMFHDWDGQEVSLGSLFGSSDELLVIHNMGKSCSFCTLWADGFNGVADHLNNRAPFVVISPDAPDAQSEFARGRGWRFRMVSDRGGAFAKACGYWNLEQDSPNPGVSAFLKNSEGTYDRAATAPLGPGDPFCGVWHLLDLLPKGRNGWSPKFEYGARDDGS